ncbi:MAG: uroporphyrinogen decarboxylase/cobalamine-independent methonine synthase family protein [Syntrophorhabdaceae bacterium]
MRNTILFQADLATTAMGILPHEDIDEALKIALMLDIPFWPQLPKISIYEDMYIQALEKFPGSVLNAADGRHYIDTGLFYREVEDFFAYENDPSHFSMGENYSRVYRKFLAMDLSRYKSIHGQVISPISLCLKIVDENGRPIVYNDDIRSVAFSFIQKRVNAQYRELAVKNEHAYVWIDDPGLEFIFNAMSGYDHVKARDELHEFYEGIEGPRGLHLCGNPDWDFLLSLNIEIISLNAYGFGDIFVNYDRVNNFIENGGIISWGIVPTYQDEFAKETAESISARLEKLWAPLAKRGAGYAEIASKSLLAPATCNLLNTDRTDTVERSFTMLRDVSGLLKERYIS